jgi:crotonobetainyl-CoA:carnitine CoA-transferase CaiB-like acyl-CoA transferase
MEWYEVSKEFFEIEKSRFKSGPLDNVVVLDVSIASPAATFASSLLAEMGAEVIKVEPPGGDELRQLSPNGEIYIEDTGLPFLVEGRNKEFITLNLEKEEGREIFKELVRHADVVLESFQPGWMDDAGIGYRQIGEMNPGIVWVSFSAYGHFGKNAEKFARVPDSNLFGLAMSSYMEASRELPEAGEPYNLPTAPGFWMATNLAGVYAAAGVVLALYYRMKSGKGQMIDITSLDSMVHLSPSIFWSHAFNEPLFIGVLPLDYAVFPYAYWRIKDGFVFASGFTDPNFRALITQLGREDLFEKYPNVFARIKLENQKELYPELAKSFEKLTFADLVQKMLEWREQNREGVAVYMKITSPKEILEENYWKERGDFRDIKVGEDRITVIDPVWRLSKTPLKLKWLAKNAGEDNGFVYKKFLGLAGKDLEELKRAEVL